MRTNEQINTPTSEKKAVELPDVSQEQISFQVFQRLSRIENALTSLDSRISERLSSALERLDTIEQALQHRGSGVARKIETKPNVRNWLNSQLDKGWVSETAILEKTGWQTIGIRSFITKARTLGMSVESKEVDGVPHYRYAK